MASASINHIYCYEATSAITTIHYNPYKPNIMAAGTANKSILLFFTASHTLTNLYTSFSRLPGQQDYCPEGIRTEFEVKDISWSPQNPSSPLSRSLSLQTFWLPAEWPMAPRSLCGTFAVRSCVC